MRIISIDVGIKNLAYCILEQNVNDNIYNVIKWDVINLCGEVPLCNCSLKPKVIKGKGKGKGKKDKSIKLEDNKNENEIITICNKKATYMKVINDVTHYYCQVHAKQSDYLLPNTSLKNIKHWKKDALLRYSNSQNIILPTDVTVTKDVLIKHINEYLDGKVLERISTVSANEMTLIQMGVKLVTEFDKVLGHKVLGHKVLLANDMSLLDHIIIENQISPIANRMKTLQGMIAQYFIMRDKPTISFISSANKLKTFAKEKTIDVSEDKDVSNNKDKKKKKSYDERKEEGVRIVKELLENNKILGLDVSSSNNINWLEHFSSHKKQDDLADAFLQGAWFLSNNSACGRVIKACEAGGLTPL